MTFSSFGDMASMFHARNLSSQMKLDMSQLATELTTGRAQDISAAVSNDFGPLASIQHSLKSLSAHESATKEASLLADTAQISLESVQNQAQSLSQGLIGAVSANNATLIETTAMDAREKFGSVVSALNTNVGGRALFSGNQTDGPALMSADAIMTELLTVVASETTASGVSGQIDAWFDDVGGGFETVGYQGGIDKLGPIRVGNGETVSLPVKADDSELRDTLRAFAKAAIISEGIFAGDLEEQKALIQKSSADMLTAVDRITLVRADLGAVQARIENAVVHNLAQKSTLELSYNKLTAVDPYETATALEALYGQMESLYTVTARLSALNFTDYMR